MARLKKARESAPTKTARTRPAERTRATDDPRNHPDKEAPISSSEAPADRIVAALRKIVPSAWNEGTLDTDALRSAIGDVQLATQDRFSFTWTGKNRAIQHLLQQTTATLRPNSSESVNFDSTQNLLIRGDNLEVLKVLYKSYFGKVKFIYIDPPYNTGKDLVYPDDYSDPVGRYLELSGQRGESGALLSSNVETSGRYHSSWLSMMYPRIFIARQLLRDDGIFVASIDDHEFADFRLLLNEIFGEENFIGAVIWNSTKTVTNTALISVSHTYNLIFARDIDYFTKNRVHFRLPEPGEGFSNPDNDPRGPWKADPFQVGGVRPNQQYTITNPNTGREYKPNPGGSWKNEERVFRELLADNRIVFGVSGEAGPQRKRFQSEAEERGRVAKTLWDDLPTTSNATRDLDALFGRHVFDNPKPVELIKRFIALGVHDPQGAIVLDFFAGSGTTVQAVLDMNAEDGGARQAIAVQLPEPTGDDEFPTIFDVMCERVKRALPETGPDCGFRVLELAPSNFTAWQGTSAHDASEYREQLQASLSPLEPTANPLSVYYEVGLKEGYGASPRVTKVPDIAENDIYEVLDLQSGRRFLISLDPTINASTISALASRLQKTDLFVCLDSALTDTSCANLAMACHLKTI